MKNKLRVILAEREMKQKDLADKVGVSLSTMSLIVRNKSLPTLPVAYRIAKELGLHIEDIWTE